METLVVKAPAKINLGLHVLRKRDDGFHEIETAMVAVGWYDHITVELADQLTFTCSDPALPTDESNLVVKAARVLADFAGYKGGAKIRLEKNIPYAAGLGGGSSDAAATLNALNRLWDLDVGKQKLAEIAASLGSDVPFFLTGQPAMATGRGELLNPIATDGIPYSLGFEILIVAPGDGISTAEAYGGITPEPDDRADIVHVLTQTPITEWEGTLVNDFQKVAFRKQPGLMKIHNYLTMVGADYVSLSGSGSAIYGLFESSELAKRANVKLRGYGLQTWLGTEVTQQ